MSDIEWTDATWNPIRGCSRISAGCENCYAEKMAHRFSGPGKAYEGLTRMSRKGPQWTGAVRLVPEALAQPLRSRRPRRVFVNSMSDLFHESVPFAFVDRVFAAMALAPRHVFQILTKRPERMLAYLADPYRQEAVEDDISDNADPWGERRQAEAMGGTWFGGQYDREGRCEAPPCFEGITAPWPLPNVWLGVSVENQRAADERIPLLLQTPAAVRFVSAEPLLGPINFDPIGNALFDRRAAIRDAMRGPAALNREQADASIAHPELDWVIVGGESGPGARPCDVEWIRSIVEQCRAASVPVFVKQLGARIRWGDAGGDWGTAHQSRCAGGIAHAKGADPTEWPDDLRVREWPEARR